MTCHVIDLGIYTINKVYADSTHTTLEIVKRSPLKFVFGSLLFISWSFLVRYEFVLGSF